MKTGNRKTKRGNWLSKLLCLVLCAVMAAGCVSVDALAAKKKEAYMKGLNISWDLKKDKRVAYQAYLAGTGYFDRGTVTIKDYKVKDLKKKGKKKLTFTALYEFNGYTSSQVDALFNSSYYNTNGGER